MLEGQRTSATSGFVADVAIGAWRGLLGEAPVVVPSPKRPMLYDVTAADSGRYYLKQIGPWRNGASLADEYRVLRHLQAAGLPVAPPLVTDDGWLCAGDGEQSCIVVPQLPGEPRDHESEVDADRICHRIGAAIGRLHRALADYPRPITTSYRQDMSAALTDAKPHCPPQLWIDTIASLQPWIEPDLVDLPEQLISGDLNPGNVLLADGPEEWRVSGLIDIDHLPSGPRIYDLAYYLSRQARSAPGAPDRGDRFLALLPHYVVGYAAENPLAAREIAALPAAIVATELGATTWSQRLLSGMYGHDNDDLHAADVAIGAAGLRWLCENYQRLTNATRL